MDHLDTVNLQLIAAVGELRMAAVCLPTDAEAAEPIRRHLLAAERRVIEAHKAASAAATSAKADARPFGPGTLDVLLAAETADPGAVCDAIEAIAGEEHGRAGAMLGRGFVLPAPLLAALVRALRGGSHGT